MTPRDTLAAWIAQDTTPPTVYAQRNGKADTERGPIGRVLSLVRINNAGVGQRKYRAFQVRIVTHDGRIYSGRSSGGLPAVTLRELVQGSHIRDYLVKVHGL